MTPKLLSNMAGAKTDIKIQLHSKRRAYSTLDRIEGTVTFTPASDLAFDAIDIEFVGTSRTYVERLTTAAAISGRSQAFHQFLRLSQPGIAAHYPADRILKAGESYQVPFVFAVPQQLLPRVCAHAVVTEAIRDNHTQLPPSLGDCEGDAKEAQLDDFAPEMASIRYGVYAKISRNKMEKGEVKRQTVCAKARKIRVVPASEEQAPLDIDGSTEFTQRKEKKLRKGLLKGKLGTLIVEAQQPSAIMLPPSDAQDLPQPTTMTTVQLRFDPLESDAKPPRLSSLTSKLKVLTFYSVGARRDYPSQDRYINEYTSGFHTESMEISSRCMANVEWELRQPERSSASSTSRSNSTSSGPIVSVQPSCSYTGGPYYVARILVPIELPSNKQFVPTFHSCLISRTYALGLSLSTSSAFGGNLDLKLPVQIAASPSLQNSRPRPSITSLTSVDYDDDSGSGIDEFFEPRTIFAPEDDFVGGSQLTSGLEDVVPEFTTRRDSGLDDFGDSGLPEYSLLAPGSRSRDPVSAF